MTEGLRLERIVRRYGAHRALDDVSIDMPANAYVSVLGPSGSGKTVLLRVIAGFETPDEGEIWFGGVRLDTIPAYERGIGFVFQNFALFPHLNVWDNVAFGLLNRRTGPLREMRVVRERVGQMLELVGLGGLEQRGVHQISGGQRQRVALARTLVTQPRLVLLDEPLGALDANLRLRMRGELRRLREQLGVSFLHVTGSEAEALAMGERVVVLDRGRIGQFSDADTVYNRPASANVARFLNCYNILRRPEADGALCIRHDLIRIRPHDEAVGPQESSLPAKFVTSEYSGSAVTYFFTRDDGQVVEVEAHLSHRSPEALEPGRMYLLTWANTDAVVFG